MRIIVLICFFLVGIGLSYSQTWQDSLRRGKELYESGNYQQAYKALVEAQRLAPSEVNLSNDIGNAAYRNKDYETAEKAFSAAAKASHNLTEQSQYWHNIGNAQFETKDYQKAIESYKQALRKDPKNDKARYNLAEAQRRINEESESEQQKNQQNQDQSDENDDSQQEANQGDEPSNQEENNTEASPNEENQEQNREGKLTEHKTERILDDLLKQEIQTKKRLREKNSGSEEEQIKSGKRW